ncbi:MAG: hypothetical protein JWQ80_1309 [Massilia sp.]|nr:hypothetical protein [Massilia sp.]
MGWSRARNAKSPAGGDFVKAFWRRGRESNPSRRLCRPLHNRFATSPRGKLLLLNWPVMCHINMRNNVFSEFWSGRRVSNSRPQPWQGCALPTELLPLRSPAIDTPFGAGEESRTLDLNLGKVALYQLSYSRTECFLLLTLLLQITGAGEESRTLDLNLGKVALYQLSYSRILETRIIAEIVSISKVSRYCRLHCTHWTGAGEEARTLDLNLGKVALYQLSYSRFVCRLLRCRHNRQAL